MKSLSIKTTTTAIILLSILISIGACKKKNPANPNAEELITTMQMNFTDSAGVKAPVQVIYRDVDGDGGNAPTQWDSIRLATNTTYNLSILLLDESKSPADTISNEVLAEGDEHLFCFSTSITATIIKTDSDGSLPIGLQSKWQIGNPTVGNTQISLRHQPDGSKDGTCTPGTADVDLNFYTLIQ